MGGDFKSVQHTFLREHHLEVVFLQLDGGHGKGDPLECVDCGPGAIVPVP